MTNDSGRLGGQIVFLVDVVWCLDAIFHSTYMHLDPPSISTVNQSINQLINQSVNQGDKPDQDWK